MKFIKQLFLFMLLILATKKIDAADAFFSIMPHRSSGAAAAAEAAPQQNEDTEIKSFLRELSHIYRQDTFDAFLAKRAQEPKPPKKIQQQLRKARTHRDQAQVMYNWKCADDLQAIIDCLTVEEGFADTLGLHSSKSIEFISLLKGKLATLK